MRIEFFKYQGNGNDFVFIDDRTGVFPKEREEHLIARMCNRKFGIGADGLVLIRNHPKADFEMVYYNADGKLGSMCGNGGRCAIHFTHSIGVAKNEMVFMAFDGLHLGKILENGWMSLEMRPTLFPKKVSENAYEIDTGSPHYVRFENDLAAIEVVNEGRKIRYSPGYAEKGINVNFVEVKDDQSLCVHTYERGVEDETLACGTGVAAAAISYLTHFEHTRESIDIETKGGPLRIRLSKGSEGFEAIWLEGPVSHVFKGYWELK
jgi:diaminopimelate epimerase